MQERLPFDPTRIRRPADRPGDAGVGLLSVTQVNELVRGALTRHVPATLHVLGEISNLSRPSSGHVYFTLKDPSAELRCVMWRSAAAKLLFAPESGMAVIATGGLEVYAQRGAYQLVVRKLEPRGVGALEVAFRQLKERLEREGLFDPRRKKPLPRIPERVALVTSPTGAAIRDILQTLRRRFPALVVLLFPVRVQGDGAAVEIAAAVDALNRHAAELGGIDVMIVGRGGGSLEDLWAFNEEVVARAIAASRIPVVSAVGHEVDVSISDLVADLRAPTPTAAAELITPTVDELLDTIDRDVARARRHVTQTVALLRARLAAVLACTSMARPVARLRQRGQLLDEWQHRLRLAAAETFRRARAALNATELGLLRYGTGVRFAHADRALTERVHRLWVALARVCRAADRRAAAHAARLERVNPLPRIRQFAERVRAADERASAAVRTLLLLRRRELLARVQAAVACDPRAVLRRGYSITRDARTRDVVRSIQSVRERLRLVIELADGEFHATAEDPRQPRLFE